VGYPTTLSLTAFGNSSAVESYNSTKTPVFLCDNDHFRIVQRHPFTKGVYIDDLCGFRDRGDMWQEISYGMEHVETTDIRFSTLDQKSQVVMLGMKVVSEPNGITLSVQPKGDGWAWLPQRFIDFSSCHTHYTKWYLFHGLLVRALTICSSEEEFFKAVIHYAQGLIVRGFPASSLRRSWNAFAYSKIQNKLARRNLTQKFIEWVTSQDFSASHLDEEAQRKQRKTKTMGKYIGTLACGMHALITFCAPTTNLW